MLHGIVLILVRCLWLGLIVFVAIGEPKIDHCLAQSAGHGRLLIVSVSGPIIRLSSLGIPAITFQYVEPTVTPDADREYRSQRAGVSPRTGRPVPGPGSCPRRCPWRRD